MSLRLFILVFTLPLSSLPAIEAGDPVDYSKLAFYPQRWKEHDHDLELVPWKGRQVTFLTMTAGHDAAVMEKFVGHLDAGWKLYADMTGRSPHQGRNVDDLPPIAAVPGGGLTCGYGCGFVGSTGIEMTHFYDGHYPKLQKDPKAVPHAYFYEMGRNYYTFGRRHDCFTTGFAVFMRYVCVDTLKLADGDRNTRKTIDEAIDVYAKTDLPFFRTFANAEGLSEKQNRLETRPSDQPVMYASAMLKLWKQHGDDWLKGFYRQLAGCPEASSKTKDGARLQCLAWFVSASCAAQKDLSPVFADQWRLPLSSETRSILKDTDWDKAGLKAAEVLTTLPDFE